MTITALELSLALSGVVAAVLALWSCHDGLAERRALAVARRNGALHVIAVYHIVTSLVRLVAALLSAGGGLWLLLLPNEADTAALVAKHCWMFYNWLMIVNLLMERWAARRMDWWDGRGGHE